MSEKPNTVDFRFRERLNKVLGGHHHNFCYQCGACVSQCPAYKYSDDFNPRSIIQMALLGLPDKLLGPDSPIWLCTNCYTCYERCPQDVRPVEVITALKNLCVEDGIAPDQIKKFSQGVVDTGMSTPLTATMIKRRAEMGLPDFAMTGYDELAKLLEDSD